MMERLRQTPSQTVGPFFAYSLTAAQYGYDYNSIVNGLLHGDHTEGSRIYITGSIYDGEGNPIPDALIEFCQADATGNNIRQYPNNPISTFKGFGRLGTGTQREHRFTFSTVKPGAVNGQAPHIDVILFMRGSLHGLYTRIYFDDEANNHDALLKEVDEARRLTLIAKRQDKNTYRFDVYMQGENETVFFEV
jgi:protocatechuate 3,4-dioxygenase alpha subunit